MNNSKKNTKSLSPRELLESLIYSKPPPRPSLGSPEIEKEEDLENEKGPPSRQHNDGPSARHGTTATKPTNQGRRMEG